MATYNPDDPTNGYQPVAPPVPQPSAPNAATGIQGPTSLTNVPTDSSWGVAPGGLPSQGASLYQALQSGLTGEQAVNWANSANNGQGGYAYRTDTGTYSLPSGGYVGQNGQGNYFLGAGDSGGGTSTQPVNATPAPPFSTGSDSASIYNTGPQSAPTVSYPTAPANASTTTSDNYQNIINGQIAQLQQPVSADNPYVRAQTDAYNLTAQRGATAAQEAAAQAGYAQGNLNSGSQSVQQMLINEALGQGEATNTGNVLATAEAQRQAALANMIGTGTSAAQQQQATTAQQNQYGSTLGLNVAGLKQTAGQQAVTSAQQQQQINDALAQAISNAQLGYYGINSNAGLNAATQLGAGG